MDAEIAIGRSLGTVKTAFANVRTLATVTVRGGAATKWMICRLRPASASGISALLETWPSG
jgi:hypothetical protein